MGLRRSLLQLLRRRVQQPAELDAHRQPNDGGVSVVADHRLRQTTGHLHPYRRHTQHC